MKRGFGIIEVLVAALVLGFLIVGLNIMQKGNRESVLRVRARDGANVVAQDVIDSISALGSASVRIPAPNDPPLECDKTAPVGSAKRSLCKERSFDGAAGDVKVDYRVTVEVKEVEEVEEKTDFVKAVEVSGDPFKDIKVKHDVAKQIDVTVKWDFKSSEQSINISSVIR